MSCLLKIIVFQIAFTFLNAFASGNWCQFTKRVPKISHEVFYYDYELVRVCCDGYEEYNSYTCKPICKPSCPTNSQCARPNVCECNWGYRGLSDAPTKIVCKPTCSPSCGENAFCARPNTCECNSDYRLNTKGLCQPICHNECPKNASCVAPNQCRCNEGYQSLNDSSVCQPICEDGCPENAICSEPGKCSCAEGYDLGKFEDNSLECVAQCHDGCPSNSYCAKPNFCQCDEGYQKSSNGSCEPICENSCPENSLCTGPNNCTCVQGYKMIDAQCQPICDKPCPEYAICVLPNKCQCLPGYQLKLSSSYKSYCEPQCPQNCSINGKCVLPNNCECLEGYEIIEDIDGMIGEVCKPVCAKGCLNGFCYRPGVCICNPGYLMGPEGECEPTCSMPCHNGSCVEPEICQCSEGHTMKEGSVNICEPQCKPECVNGLCVDVNVCICHDYYEPVTTENGSYNHNICQEIGTTPISTTSTTATTNEEFITVTEATTINYEPAYEVITDFDRSNKTLTSTRAPFVNAAICTERCQCWQEYDELGPLSTGFQCVHPCADAYDKPCLNFSLCKCDEVNTQLHCKPDDDDDDEEEGEEDSSLRDESLVYVCKLQQLFEYTKDRANEIVDTTGTRTQNTRWLWIVLGSITGGCAFALIGILLYMKLRRPEETIVEYEM